MSFAQRLAELALAAARRLRLLIGQARRPRHRADGFAAWQIFNAPSERARKLVQRQTEPQSRELLFSLILASDGLIPESLDELIGSIAAQSYRCFELILADTSHDDAIAALMDNWKSREARVRVLAGAAADKGAAAINRAAKAAQGQFLVLIEESGRLTEDALLALADHLASHANTDLLYADDAVLARDGRGLVNPRFRPDWSPELLLSSPYAGPLLVIRASLFAALGGCRAEAEGAHAYDLMLRAAELGGHVGHMPQLLFLRRPSGEADAEGQIETARSIVADALLRRGLAWTIASADWAADAGTPVFLAAMPDTGPSVAILIATRNNRAVLERLLKSLATTAYRNFTVHIIDNESDDPETLAYFQSLQHQVLRIANPGGKFNYAYIHNRAAERVDAKLLLFLNDDTEVISPAWLSRMVGWSQLPGVGAVGARLLFPDGRVQHGGVVLGLRKGLTAFRGLPGSDPGYLGLAKTTRNCIAVTAACMLTPCGLFLEQGGFDEIDFAVSYNDVDYGIRLNEAGYRVVYCAEAELYHHQGYSRGRGSTLPAERAALERRYGWQGDPFYSPHLSLDSYWFAIKPWVEPKVSLKRPLRVLLVTGLGDTGPAVGIGQSLTFELRKAGEIELHVASAEDDPMVRQRSAPGAFDVVCVIGLDCFATIEAAAKSDLPSIWIIGDDDAAPVSVERSRLAGCFALPYRVLFISEAGRQRFARFDHLDNFDLLPRATDEAASARAAAVYRNMLVSAAFSAVPWKAARD